MHCKRWQLTINTKKTKIMVFSKSGRVGTKLKFYLNGLEIEIVKSYCYLGINFSPNGTFKLALNSLVDKASRALFKLITSPI
jgi:hypothetical protein